MTVCVWMAVRNKKEQKSRALHQLNAVEFVIEVPDPAGNLIFQLIWQPPINEKKRNNETKKRRRRRRRRKKSRQRKKRDGCDLSSHEIKSKWARRLKCLPHRFIGALCMQLCIHNIRVYSQWYHRVDKTNQKKRKKKKQIWNDEIVKRRNRVMAFDWRHLDHWFYAALLVSTIWYVDSSSKIIMKPWPFLDMYKSRYTPL